MKNTNSIWMVISGAAGITFFLIANFTNTLAGSAIVAACLQLAVNAFVFLVWSKAFLQSSGFKRFIAFFGVVVPFGMATVTVIRVVNSLASTPPIRRSGSVANLQKSSRWCNVCRRRRTVHQAWITFLDKNGHQPGPRKPNER